MDPEPIMLDLVQPQRAGGRLQSFHRKAGLNEPGWQGTRTRQHAGLIAQTDGDKKALGTATVGLLA